MSKRIFEYRDEDDDIFHVTQFEESDKLIFSATDSDTGAEVVLGRAQIEDLIKALSSSL